MNRPLALALLFAACSKAPTSAPAPPPKPRPARDYGPLDMLPASAGGLTLAMTRAPKPGAFLEAWYDWHRAGRVEIAEPLRRGYDARLQCDRGAGIKVKGDPQCGTSKGKKTRIGDRVVCFDTEEKTGPGGMKPYGAYTAWTGLGNCSIQFTHGQVPDKAARDEAIAATGAVADWMDRFLVDGQRPDAATLATNRRALDVALRARPR